MSIYEKPVAKFGKDNRRMKACEELAELMGIAKDDRANVLEELCQVRHQLKMIEEVYGFSLVEVTKLVLSLIDWRSCWMDRRKK